MLNYNQHHAATAILSLVSDELYIECDQVIREFAGEFTLSTFISDYDDQVEQRLTIMEAIVLTAWSLEEDRPFTPIPTRPIDPEDQDFELPF